MQICQSFFMSDCRFLFILFPDLFICLSCSWIHIFSILIVESLIVTFGWVVWSMKENYLDLNCRTHERFMDWFTLKKKNPTYYQHKSMCSTEEGMSLPEINSPGYFQARGKRHLNSLKSKSSPEHVSSFHCSEASMSKSEKEQVCDLRGAWPGVEKSVMDEFSYI